MSPEFRFNRLGVCLTSLLLGLGLAAGMAALLGVPAALAAGITVTTTHDELNSDSDCSLREAIQAANTDAAVDACPAGSGADTIYLPVGTYTLTLTGAGEDANATGDLDITSPLRLDGADMATTVINANALDRALHVPTPVALTMFELTVRNGNVAGDGGGLYAAGLVVLSDTTFVGNTATDGGLSGYGGGAYFSDAVTVMDTTFAGNTAVGGGGANFSGVATVMGTTFTGNTTTSDIGGGALFSGAATVTGTTFLSNTAPSSGGGAYFLNTTTVMGTAFTGNTTTSGFGGGAWFDSAATVMGTTFTDNAASANGGGALFAGAAMVMDTAFTGNTAHIGGGAVFSDFATAATMTGTTFLSNTANFLGGGAVFVGAATVMDTAFINNIAHFGGGAYINDSGAADFVNTLFAANHAGSGQGAGLYTENLQDDVITLRHVTIASPTVGSGSAVFALAGAVNVTNTIVASYSVGLEGAGGALNENYNLFSGVATPYSGTVVSGGNSLTGTAAFADLTNYRLTQSSAALDAGTAASSPSDFEGDPRPVGPGFDIGWDELMIPISGLAASNDSPKQFVQSVYFTATISAGTGVSYLWNFGDGQLGSAATVNHTYDATGNYTAVVTATNSLGSVSATLPVTITEAAFKFYLPLIRR